MLFRNKYFYLSNMYPATCTDSLGYTYKCSEAYFQACKCKDVKDRINFTNLDGYGAKRLGRTVELVDNWDELKDKFMLLALFAKFTQNPELGKQLVLLVKSGTPIQKDNYWNDTYWGVCKGKGKNRLGELLTKVGEALNE